MKTARFQHGAIIVEKKTGKKDANFALIGRFDGGPFAVISLHKDANGADPRDVHNDRWSSIKVAFRIEG